MNKSIYRYLLGATILAVTLMLIFPSTTYAQRLLPQPKNFVAILTGKDMVPPVDTKASGTARFHMNSNGTVCYYIDVKNITGVLGSHIGLKNGTELAQLLNPYADVATIGSYPTGAVDGILGSGEIKARGSAEPPFSSAPGSLSGPLLGKNVTDLDKMIAGNNTYVTIRTSSHEDGEIQGQILPTNMHVTCLSTMRFTYPPSTMPAASNFGPWPNNTTTTAIGSSIDSSIALVKSYSTNAVSWLRSDSNYIFTTIHIFCSFFFVFMTQWDEELALVYSQTLLSFAFLFEVIIVVLIPWSSNHGKGNIFGNDISLNYIN